MTIYCGFQVPPFAEVRTWISVSCGTTINTYHYCGHPSMFLDYLLPSAVTTLSRDKYEYKIVRTSSTHALFLAIIVNDDGTSAGSSAPILCTLLPYQTWQLIGGSRRIKYLSSTKARAYGNSGFLGKTYQVGTKQGKRLFGIILHIYIVPGSKNERKSIQRGHASVCTGSVY